MKTKTFEKLPEEKQSAILDASARVFAEKGYFQAGIDEICRAAQISNGALYKYFVNKEGLYKTVARRTLDLILMEYNQFEGKGESFWEMLRMAIEQVNPFTTSYRDYFIVFMDLGSPSMPRSRGRPSDPVSDPHVYPASDPRGRGLCASRRGRV